MLDLKAKLLAAGLVTADQVKKVEDDEVAKNTRDQERRDADRRRREEGGPRRDGGAPRRDNGGPRGRPDHAPRADNTRADTSANPRPASASDPGRARDTRSFKERRADENLERRAKREHEWTEAARWRGRLDALKAAGKTEQYDATRGWVMKDRLDNKVISDAAERFFFLTWNGTLSHLTVEPDIKAQLVDGSAGIVAFVGYNGPEHAVVPKDIAVDVRAIKPEWLRHLIGITDIEPPLVKPAAEPGADGAADDVVTDAIGSDDRAASDDEIADASDDEIADDTASS